jgi:formylglycine-generating enzyme required for sulfatase activity
MKRYALIMFVIALSVLSGCGPGESSDSLPDGTKEGLTDTLTESPIPSLGDTRVRSTDGMVMVYVPPGEFEMGSTEEDVDYALELCLEYGTNCRRWYFSVEQPLHPVELDGFWLDRTEVNNEQYETCVEAGVCSEAGCGDDTQLTGGNLPVVCVTWDQAAAYCEWAGARLPTEAEWEYAARGLDGRRYPWGDEFDGSLLNYCDSNCAHDKRDEMYDDGYARSAPVGSYPDGASWTGALDMAGNVWELVADWNGEYSEERQVNPTGPLSGNRRVARGGSWNTSPDHARSALRTNVGEDDIVAHAGFRCAFTAP